MPLLPSEDIFATFQQTPPWHQRLWCHQMGCIVLLKVMICTSLGVAMYFLRYSVVALMFEWTPCLWCYAGQPNLHSPSNIGSVKYYFFCTFCFFFTLHQYYLWIRVKMADPTLFQSTPSLKFLLSGLRISCDWSNTGLMFSFLAA